MIALSLAITDSGVGVLIKETILNQINLDVLHFIIKDICIFFNRAM